ncbi:unnamed protein product, partial [Rotaria sp. Silwood1]
AYYLPSNSPSIKEISPRRDAFEDATQQKSNLIEKNIKVQVWKKVRPMLIGFSLALGVTICVIAGLVIFITTKPKESNSSSSNTTQQTCDVTCTMSGTPYRPSTIAYWPFNGNLYDLNNIYSGTYSVPSSSPSYTTGSFDQAIVFDGSHYVNVDTHFLNLSYRSWTIEGWILLSDLSSERGIFSQSRSSTTTGQCFNLSVKNKPFVYDYSLMKQSIYLNGVLDGTTGGTGTSSGPYKGTTGSVMIGRTYSGSYFKGDMDHLQVISGAKTTCQILSDAILTAYYSFDASVLNLDLSNNYINGISSSISVVSGRINEAYFFQGTTSYFQSTAFTAYSTGHSFSISLWVKPSSVLGGTLIHLSTGSDGTGTACFDLLGFSSTGQLIANLYDTYSCCYTYYSTSIGGPIMSTSIWTHIVLTYSSSNGMALYTNGTLHVVNDAFTSFPSNGIVFTSRPYMIVGNPSTTGSVPSSCLVTSPALSPGHYQGIIDDLRIYSRELTSSEVCSLYNL